MTVEPFETQSTGRCELSPEPFVTRIGATRGETQAGNTPGNEDGPDGVNQDGSPAPRQEDPSRMCASRTIGGRGTLGRSGGEVPARRLPSSPPQLEKPPMPRRGPPVAAIKVPGWHRPEWWNERRPRGSEPRGPLREAPKGQPVIRREHLVADRVDDPKGHPMIHGCRRPHRQKPSGKPKDKNGGEWPIVVTVDKSGQERTWGRSPEPLL